MLRRRATVKRTPDGWVVTLVGGSESKPLPTWRRAFDLADRHTRLALTYWQERGIEPCS